MSISKHSTEKRFPGATAAFAGALVLAILAGAPAAVSAEPWQQQLRERQQRELDGLRDTYRKLGNSSAGAAANKSYQDTLRQNYSEKASEIRQRHLQSDTRGREVDGLIDRYAYRDRNGNVVRDAKTGKVLGDLANTGSNPKDVRSDVDLKATTPGAANEIVQKWKNGNHAVDEYVHKFVNKTTDTTLWRPCESKSLCEAAKLADSDAFVTEGGLQRTGNVDNVRDPKGWYLDNEKKFIHGKHEALTANGNGLKEAEGLKTASKSLDKAAEAAGIKNPNDTLFRQAEGLRGYKDPVEVGIADPGHSQPEQTRRVGEFLDAAERKMREAKGILERQGQIVDQTREGTEAALRGSRQADPRNQDWDRGGADAISERRERVRISNEKAAAANAEDGSVGTKPGITPPELELPTGRRANNIPSNDSRRRNPSSPGASEIDDIAPGRGRAGATGNDNPVTKWSIPGIFGRAGREIAAREAFNACMGGAPTPCQREFCQWRSCIARESQPGLFEVSQQSAMNEAYGACMPFMSPLNRCTEANRTAPERIATPVPQPPAPPALPPVLPPRAEPVTPPTPAPQPPVLANPAPPPAAADDFKTHSLSAPFQPGGSCPAGHVFEACQFGPRTASGLPERGWVGCVTQRDENFVCTSSNAPPNCTCRQDRTGKVPPREKLIALAPRNGQPTAGLSTPASHAYAPVPASTPEPLPPLVLNHDPLPSTPGRVHAAPRYAAPVAPPPVVHVAPPVVQAAPALQLPRIALAPAHQPRVAHPPVVYRQPHVNIHTPRIHQPRINVVRPPMVHSRVAARPPMVHRPPMINRAPMMRPGHRVYRR